MQKSQRVMITLVMALGGLALPRPDRVLAQEQPQQRQNPPSSSPAPGNFIS